MQRLMSDLQRIRVNEQGHAAAGLTSLAAAVGAVGLGVGAAMGSDVAAVAGGIQLPVVPASRKEGS